METRNGMETYGNVEYSSFRDEYSIDVIRFRGLTECHRDWGKYAKTFHSYVLIRIGDSNGSLQDNGLHDTV
jgi:hypothetical protein